jgi:hypothetical protein
MGKLNLEAHGAKLGYYFVCLQHRKSHLPEFTAQVVKILQNDCCGVSAWKTTTRLYLERSYNFPHKSTISVSGMSSKAS